MLILNISSQGELDVPLLGKIVDFNATIEVDNDQALTLLAQHTNFAPADDEAQEIADRHAAARDAGAPAWDPANPVDLPAAEAPAEAAPAAPAADAAPAVLPAAEAPAEAAPAAPAAEAAPAVPAADAAPAVLPAAEAPAEAAPAAPAADAAPAVLPAAEAPAEAAPAAPAADAAPAVLPAAEAPAAEPVDVNESAAPALVDGAPVDQVPGPAVSVDAAAAADNEVRP